MHSAVPSFPKGKRRAKMDQFWNRLFSALLLPFGNEGTSTFTRMQIDPFQPQKFTEITWKSQGITTLKSSILPIRSWLRKSREIAILILSISLVWSSSDQSGDLGPINMAFCGIHKEFKRQSTDSRFLENPRKSRIWSSSDSRVRRSAVLRNLSHRRPSVDICAPSTRRGRRNISKPWEITNLIHSITPIWFRSSKISYIVDFVTSSPFCWQMWPNHKSWPPEYMRIKNLILLILSLINLFFRSDPLWLKAAPVGLQIINI